MDSAGSRIAMIATTGCAVTFALILLFAISLVDLIFAIVGTIILVDSNNIIHGPWDLWIYLLIQVILFWIMALDFGTRSYTKITTKEEVTNEQVTNNSTTVEKRTTRSFLLQLIVFGISIWGFVIYYHIDDISEEFYEENYYSLWRYMQAVTLYYLTIYGVIGSLIGLCCCLFPCYIYAEHNRQKNLNSKLVDINERFRTVNERMKADTMADTYNTSRNAFDEKTELVS